MEEHYTWLFNKSDNSGLLGAAFCSLLLHVLMVIVMATTSIFYPTAGDSTKLDVVWLYPSFLFGGETDTPSPVQSSPEPPIPVSPVREPSKAQALPPVTPEPEPVREAAPPSPPQAAEEEVEPPAIAPEPTTDPEPEPEMTIPAAPAPVQTAKAEVRPPEPVAKKETPPPAEKAPPPKEEPKGKPAVDNRELAKAEKPVPVPVPPPSPSAKVVPPPRETPLQPPKPAATVPKPPAAVQQTAVKESPPLPQIAPAMPRKENAAVPTASLKPIPATIGGGRGTSVVKRSEPPAAIKPVAVDRPVEKAAAQSTGPKGIFAPPLTGDLKIEITGPEELLKAVKISAIFREYPKTRHNRPMTKAIARNFQTLTPKTARVAKNTLQAVIEIAGEGVYEFRDLSDPATPGEATFSIKIYEHSGRGKTKPAGTRKVGNKGSIVKVLMPEGILWNDDAAFSGSMEDSESITKFNSETGLTWKEYKE